jgi:hypothetical protein
VAKQSVHPLTVLEASLDSATGGVSLAFHVVVIETLHPHVPYRNMDVVYWWRLVRRRIGYPYCLYVRFPVVQGPQVQTFGRAPSHFFRRIENPVCKVGSIQTRMQCVKCSISAQKDIKLSIEMSDFPGSISQYTGRIVSTVMSTVMSIRQSRRGHHRCGEGLPDPARSV